MVNVKTYCRSFKFAVIDKKKKKKTDLLFKTYCGSFKLPVLGLIHVKPYCDSFKIAVRDQ